MNIQELVVGEKYWYYDETSEADEILQLRFDYKINQCFSFSLASQAQRMFVLNDGDVYMNIFNSVFDLSINKF